MNRCFFPRKKNLPPQFILAAAAGVIAGNLFIISALPNYLWGGFFQRITGLLPVAAGLLAGLIPGVFLSSTAKALKTTIIALLFAGALCLLVILLPALFGLARETGVIYNLAVQRSFICVLLSIPGSAIGCLVGRYFAR